VTSQVTLPPSPASVSAARRFVVAALLEHDAPGACDDAATLVSELATNAVLHARTPFTVEVSCVERVVRISVRDQSVAQPRVRDYGTSATTGRGMRLVEAMSSQWGVEQESDGKSVWIDLPQQGAARDAPPWDQHEDVDDLLAAFGAEDDVDDVKAAVTSWRESSVIPVAA